MAGKRGENGRGDEKIARYTYNGKLGDAEHVSVCAGYLRTLKI